MRKETGLSLREFSQQTGVAPSTIQKIETKKMIPSISVLMKIAQGLNKSLNYFIEEGEARTEVQLIKKEGRRISYNAHCRMFVEDLGARILDPIFDGIVLRVKSGGGSDEEELSHRGEELVYTLKGKIEFTIKGARYILTRGDCLHFKSALPHSWKNVGKTEAEMIMITSPPWFS